MDKIKEQTFNELMDSYIEAVKTLTPIQIEACGWAMGNTGWTIEAMTQVFERDKLSTRTIPNINKKELNKMPKFNSLIND